MDFLGFYNLIMALAMAGACGVCDGSDNGPDYGADSAYYDGGASSLPPAAAIINRPPTMVDNGYNPAFYWNQPPEQDADAYGDAGDGYPNYPNYPAYPSYSAYSQPGYGFADNEAGGGYYGGYAGGYYAEGGDEDGYDDGAYRAHRRHREMTQRRERDQPRGMGEHAARGAERRDLDRGDRDARIRAASDNRAAGYDGHDRHMFDGGRRDRQQ